MDSIVDMLFLRHLYGLLEKTKITGDGYMELVLKRSYGEGSCLLKPIGKTIIVSTTDITFRRENGHIARDQPEYFYISFSHRTMRGIVGSHVKKNGIYCQHHKAGYCHSGVGVSFLPDFFDPILNSRHGISPDELVRAFNALHCFPLIPDAALILKQIGEASFNGDIGNLWIEAKILELVAIVLDWYRRHNAEAQPSLKENDQAGIAEAMQYTVEHYSEPLTLEILAKQAAMSISKFTAAFKTHTGISAAAYIRRIRMDKAMDLLKNTSAPLGDIAGIVGYKHHSNFSSFFLEQFGVTPSEFRKRE
jgi:AraC-like DNA-binding protein